MSAEIEPPSDAIDPFAVPFASGRAADLFDLGNGRVVRRLRAELIPAGEPAAMHIAAAAGFPVPRLFAWSGSDMELDKIDGVDMLAQVGKQPWKVFRIARQLADLHLQLRAVSLDDVQVDDRNALVDRFGGGDTLVHGDLHPGNVMLTRAGPVVIDWSNAGVGPADGDVALTWMLLSVGDPGDSSRVMRAVIVLLRGVLVRTFLRRAGRPSPATVRAVADHRLGDPNFSPAELAAIRRFRQANGDQPVGPETQRS